MNKLFYPFIVLSIFLIDRVTKVWVLKNLYFSELNVFSFFSVRYVENTGIAFGLLSGNNTILLITNTIFLAVIVGIRKKFSDSFSSIGIHFVIGGALGNIYDRIVYKYVIDFLDFHFFPAVFNVADASITIGAFLICLSMILEKIKGDKK